MGTLIESIQSEIDKSGGREKLAQIIANENPEYFTYRQRKELDDMVAHLETLRGLVSPRWWLKREIKHIIHAIDNELSVKHSAKVLGRSFGSVGYMRKRLLTKLKYAP